MPQERQNGPTAAGSETEALRSMIDCLKAALAGDLGARVAQEAPSPLLAELRTHLNDHLHSVEETVTGYHDRSMEVAIGLSECFQVLLDLRRGRLSARVSEGTLASSEELVRNMGHLLNETIDDLASQIEKGEQQREAIRELSTPILQLWDGVIAMPLIGLVDTRRSAEIMESVLTAVASQQTCFVILDITAVAIVDTRTADYLIKIIRAAELLGARCFLTGIQPAVAQTLVEIGVDLSSIRTLRNLRDGLRECLRLGST